MKVQSRGIYPSKFTALRGNIELNVKIKMILFGLHKAKWQSCLAVQNCDLADMSIPF